MNTPPNTSWVTCVFFLDGEILYICAESDSRRFRSSGTSTVSQRKLDTHRKQTRHWLALTGNTYSYVTTKYMNLDFCKPAGFSRKKIGNSFFWIGNKLFKLFFPPNFYFYTFWLQELMKIIFCQQIFLHHLLCPSNITSWIFESRKELLFLGWTQPICGHLTAFDCSPVIWAMSHYWTQGTPGRKLIQQRQEAKSLVFWGHTSWSRSVTLNLEAGSVCPQLMGPYL